ncbi:MAG TPA: GNAT family N-acetyltransferase [Rudaea sp.]|nr:GNAT family N-acetyltransferase [Rudaea sp.]HSC10298.1 GNAT family N-acetyltransferase [Rhodanobacteraceae bacterium]
MTAAFRIRRATPEDLPALLALESSAFTTDHLSARQYRQHLVSPTGLVLVATDASGLLGSALVFFRHQSDLARLYSIAVAHGARGRGVGEALLAAVEDAALHRGARRMRLEVRHDNAAAMRLYERRGYARFAERPGYYEDGGHAWRYEKKLGLRAEG